MGVYRFFGDYIAKLPYTGLQPKALPRQIESLSLDANGIIHTVWGKIYNYGPVTAERAKIVAISTDEQLEAEAFLALGQELIRIIEAIRPTNALVIAIDGVPPRAKANQMKGRRFMKALPKLAATQALGVESKVRFDSNAITPGTEFMKRLDAWFRSWLATNRAALPPIVIYSSHLSAGEGEHKIFRYFRAGTVPRGNGYHVIYGLDADLIMLSSLSDYPIILCREGPKASISDPPRSIFSPFVDISVLKTNVVEELNRGRQPAAPVNIVIQDYVLFVYLIGNDFLPHMMAFDEVGEAMTEMFAVYNELKKQGTLTRDNGQINWEMLANFLFLLSQDEEKMLMDKASRFFNYPSTTLDAATVRVERPGTQATLRSSDRRYEVKSFDYDRFRTLWYTLALGPRTTEGQLLADNAKAQPVTVASITNMCQLYLFGLQWILQYYIGGQATQKFIYYYKHAPLLRDLTPVLVAQINAKTSYAVSDVLVTASEAVLNPYQLLTAVLPPASVNLLPEDLRDLILPAGEVADLAPTVFIVEREGKDEEHQGIPILPTIDIDRVVVAVDEVLQGSLPDDVQPQKDWVSERAPNVAIPRLGGGRGAPRGRGRGGFAPRGGGDRGGFVPRGSNRGRGRGGSRGGRGRGGEYVPRGRGVDMRRGASRGVTIPTSPRTTAPAAAPPAAAATTTNGVWTNNMLM